MKSVEYFLNESFPDMGFKVIKKLLGGMMNNSLILEDKSGKKYVLYLPTEQANEMVDRELEKENQKITIDLGITSNNFYFNPETGIKINEYIEGDSLNNVDSYDINEVARILKVLHSSKTLSKKDYEPFNRLLSFEKERQGLGFKNTAEYSKIAENLYKKRDYLCNDNLVLSHNDFQKSNIVKSINNEYFVIDFEFMMNNVEIYDIACFGNGLVSEGFELLKAYFDDNITKEHIKKYYLWRTFVSLQWYNVAIIKHIRGEGETHKMDFMAVANHFFENAKEAYNSYLNIQ